MFAHVLGLVCGGKDDGPEPRAGVHISCEQDSLAQTWQGQGPWRPQRGAWAAPEATWCRSEARARLRSIPLLQPSAKGFQGSLPCL